MKWGHKIGIKILDAHLLLPFAMASNIDWDALLDKKYPSYKVEVLAYLDSLDVTFSTEISAQHIYHAIRNDNQVNENLKFLYREALHGKNKDVKSCIKNRVSNFRRNLR